MAAENLPGGFSAVYDVLKALEESGRIRRGYFVAGLGATQFALPAAVDLLRSLRTSPQQEKPEMVQMAATDPANPYGSVLRWPAAAAADDGDDQSPRIVDAQCWRKRDPAQRRNDCVSAAEQSEPADISAGGGAGSIATQRVTCAHFLARNTLADMQRHDADRRGGLLISQSMDSPLISIGCRESCWPRAFMLRRWASLSVARPCRRLHEERSQLPEVQ